MRILAAFLAICTLASCSITAPRDVGNANMITLSAPLDIPVAKRKHGALKVNYPSAPSDLDTFRIAVQKSDGKQDYFARSRWSEFLPSVVQAALTEALAKSGRFSYVGADDGNVNNTYILRVDIEECRAIYSAPKTPPQTVMRIVFNLSGAHSKRNLATFRLEGKATASSNTLADIQKAFNAAFADITLQAIERLQKIK